MTGELWRGNWAIGKETVYNTPVAGSRLLYTRSDSVLNTGVTVEDEHYAINRRDNVLGHSVGPLEPTGRLSVQMDPDEILEFLDITIGAADTTGVGPYTHVFTPGNTAPNSGTLYVSDGANPWRQSGVYGNQLRIQGGANTRNILSLDAFGGGFVANAFPSGLTERAADFIQGWQTNFYLDDLGDTPGSSQVQGVLVNWDLTFDNQLQRLYTAQNTNFMRRAVLGEIAAGGRFLMVADQALTLAELNHFLANDAKRLVRLRFLRAGGTYYVDVDLPGVWTAADLGQAEAGLRAYGMDYRYEYDATNAFGFQVTCVSTRATLY